MQITQIEQTIPDNVYFTHILMTQYIHGGGMLKQSIFDIPGIGQLRYGVNQRICVNTNDLYEFYNSGCNRHMMPIAKYNIGNDLLKITNHINGIGSIYWQNELIGQFEKAEPNCVDMFCGRINSAYPQFRINNLKQKNQQLLLYPDPNSCPQLTGCNCFCCCFTACGIKQKYREFKVQNSNGIVIIKNRRNQQQACQNQCCFYLLFCCCGLEADYPDFDIEFSKDVSQVERALILAGLIYFNLFETWASIDGKGQNFS